MIPGFTEWEATPTGAQSGIAPVPRGQPAVPVANLKLEPPPRFNGGRHPGVRAWLQTVERWLCLQQYRVEDWVDIVPTRLEGAALSWINTELTRIQCQQRAPFGSWEDFRAVFTRTFEPTTDQELARQQLKALR